MSTGPTKRQQRAERRTERRPRLTGSCGQGRCHTCQHADRCGCVCHDAALDLDEDFPIDWEVLR